MKFKWFCPSAGDGWEAVAGVYRGYPIPALLLVYQDKGVTKHEVEVV